VRWRLADGLFDWLAASGRTAIVTDTPGRPDMAHHSLTSPTLFLRLLAEEDHPSTPLRLGAWAERLRWWGERGLREAYVSVHAPDHRGIVALTERATAAFGDLAVPRPAGPQLGLFGR
jgi:hypothetical protein